MDKLNFAADNGGMPGPRSVASVIRPSLRIRAPGLILVVVIGLLAMLVGRSAPLIGGAVFGLLFGVAIRYLLAPNERFTPGIAVCGNQVLQCSIIALGFGLDLTQVVKTGLESLWVTLVTMCAAFVAAGVLRRWLGVHHRLTILIGVGTAICGGSAIAAVAPIVRSDGPETASAISTIFLFSIVAVLVFPWLGHLMNMSDVGFGLWVGTAINDTSSVVAVGYSYSEAAGDYATIVKLTRSTLIIPVCLVLALVVAGRDSRRHAQSGSIREGVRIRAFPWFILGFVAASSIRSIGLVPAALEPPLHVLADVLIVVALTAIGLSANIHKMMSSGGRPIALGLGVWIAVIGSSLLMQRLTGQM